MSGMESERIKEDMKLDMDPKYGSDSAKSRWDRANGMEAGRGYMWGIARGTV